VIEQPEALRLADELMFIHVDSWVLVAAAAELRRLHQVEVERNALRSAAIEFIRKVESGEARSVRSYAQFKQALAESEEVKP
jgi:hypothetical protein